VTVAPRQIIQLLRNAVSYSAEGDFAKAEEEYLRVLAYDYRTIEVLPALARTVLKKGDLEGALGHWNKVLERDPRHLEAMIEKGVLLHRLERTAEAICCFTEARSIAPENELVLSNLAVALADSGRRDEALAEFRRALALNPNNLHLRHQMRRLTSVVVPFWHIPMLNDTRRNDAFERAIRQVIEKEGPDSRILDIGTGSGLLSMMAARAGATNIVSCEKVPVIAETAERIIASNGYAKKIRIVNKSSNQLIVGHDLEARADILISEILSSDLLAEYVLSTFEDAHARLLRKGATVIPRAATAVGCLVESDLLSSYTVVRNVSGFDVSPFSALSAQRLPVHGTMTSWRRLSSDIDLLTIDLTASQHEDDIRLLSIPVQEDGVAIGIVQWIRVDLAEGIIFSNHPDDYSDGGWLQVLHTFPEPIKVTTGEKIDVMVGNDRTSLIVMPALQHERQRMPGQPAAAVNPDRRSA